MVHFLENTITSMQGPLRFERFKTKQENEAVIFF